MRTLAVLLAASWLIPASVAAQNLEGVLMPGKVIAGHAKLENDCGKCHVKFDRAAQDRLCLDCHKPVATDVARHQGYHGRINVESCRTCHTDHKGREMQIALVDEKAFDHAKTDFALSGAHARAKCASRSWENAVTSRQLLAPWQVSHFSPSRPRCCLSSWR